ncbi:hypothetical protein LO772_28935 [Yinghuangia sp. ASG 101]|uniref:hypothetical protein n=1 Tax=Yinghuangia sp. ASG 101 TaxID=2896848 RepID=UPI001E6070B8|nr:hypothetical protein [Yinghuangia sp. ASG 101]UGQ10803.1 hypothetical protein LO772_28935 [Yinghuangia sp. ASG 101]
MPHASLPLSRNGLAAPTRSGPSLREIIRRYPAVAPVDVLPDIHRLHAEHVAAEQEAGTAEAALGASLAADLVARTYLDLGDPRAAVAQADAALIYADRARSHGARVRHRALQSLSAYWAGWPHEALRYARLGSISDQAGGSGPAMLKAVEARSHALLGDGLAASDALRAADAAAASEPDELDALGGLLRFDEARRTYFEAEARVHIPGGARTAAERALTAIRLFRDAAVRAAGSAAVQAERRLLPDPTDPADPADPAPADALTAPDTAPETAACLAVLALAHARQDNLDGVRAALDDLLPLDPVRRTLPVVLSTARVHAELRRPAWIRDPRVRDMQELIETFCQVPAGSTAG